MTQKEASNIMSIVCAVLGMVAGFYGILDLVLSNSLSCLLLAAFLFIVAIYFELRTK